MSSRNKVVSVFVLTGLVAAILASTVYSQVSKPPLRAITVISEPNATVWIDDVRYGTTNESGRLAISSVMPGVRSLRVRAQGFTEVNKSLPATAKGDVNVPLTKTTDEAELAFQAADALTTVDRGKAIAEFQRAIKLRPNYPAAYIGMARMYSETGDIEKAIASIRSAKRLKPGYAEASAVEARLQKDADQEDKAIATFKRAITEGRGFQPEAYTGLGLLYKDRAENAGGSGDYETEQANYNEAGKNLAVAVKQLGSAPDGIVVYQLLGLIYERQKKYNEAIALYEEFLRIYPDSSEAGAVASFITQIKKQMAEPK